VFWPVPTSQPPITSALVTLQALFEPGGADEYSALLATAPDGVTGDTIGHRLYLRRHFDRTACFIGREALSDLNDPASLNNFSAMLAKTEADDPDLYPIDWLASAQFASKRAVELSPRTSPTITTIYLRSALQMG
jgi:hypothetical protein